MPTFGILIIFNCGGYVTFSIPPSLKYMVYAIVFLNTFIVPVIISMLLLKKGIISSMNMTTIQERRFPFLLTALFYFFTYYILQKAPLPPVLYLVILGATLSVLITLIINLSWKISVHMVGIGGLIGAVIGISTRFMLDMQILIVVLIICAGLIGFSRLKLNAHEPGQVYWGFLLGLSCEMLIIITA